MLMVLQFILPVILAIIAGYGSVRYASGETQQRLTDLDRRVQANTEKLEKMNERMISRDEMKQFIDSMRSDQTDIKNDIRSLRDRR
jgi:uncharacterized protein YPO0396